MATSKSYFEFIREQLAGIEGIAFRAMMGEYIIYYFGKVVGGIYDDRFLVKPVKAARRLMPGAPFEQAYEGAKEMLLVVDIENKEFLKILFTEMLDELPEPKKKLKT